MLPASSPPFPFINENHVWMKGCTIALSQICPFIPFFSASAAPVTTWGLSENSKKLASFNQRNAGNKQTVILMHLVTVYKLSFGTVTISKRASGSEEWGTGSSPACLHSRSTVLSPPAQTPKHPLRASWFLCVFSNWTRSRFSFLTLPALQLLCVILSKKNFSV